VLSNKRRIKLASVDFPRTGGNRQSPSSDRARSRNEMLHSTGLLGARIVEAPRRGTRVPRARSRRARGFGGGTTTRVGVEHLLNGDPQKTDARRGIIEIMKVAITTDMRICTRYER